MALWFCRRKRALSLHIDETDAVGLGQWNDGVSGALGGCSDQPAFG
jgi:hypothetical protein